MECVLALTPVSTKIFLLNLNVAACAVLNHATTTGNDVSHVAFAKKLFCGAFAGVVGASLASPFFLVKTRMQVQSNVAAIGEQYHYRSILHAFRSIYEREGLRGMYRGVPAAALRVAMGSSVQLATYDTTKERIIVALRSTG